MTTDQILSLTSELAGFLREFAGCFGRSEPRGKLETYVRGQLGELPRKSIEPIALAADMKPRTLQEFLASDGWDEDRMADSTRLLVAGDDASTVAALLHQGHRQRTDGVGDQVHMATNALIDAIPLSEPEQSMRLKRAARRLMYWQRRDAQARKSHTKTRRREFERHHVDLAQLPRCHPP